MALNPYFNFNRSTAEQNLYEGLIIQSIQIYGMDLVYVPKDFVDRNLILGEDPQKAFTRSYTIEMYFENVEGFGGDKAFISKLGFNIEKQATFVVARKRFDEVVNPSNSPFVRPYEGDLIFFPLTRELFEINSVEHEDAFYQTGRSFVWKMSCEKFNFSHEKIDTGNPDIDSIADEFENNNSVVNDPLADNENISDKIQNFLDTDSPNPLTEQ